MVKTSVMDGSIILESQITQNTQSLYNTIIPSNFIQFKDREFS